MKKNTIETMKGTREIQRPIEGMEKLGGLFVKDIAEHPLL